MPPENEIVCPYCYKQMELALEFGAGWYKCECGATHSLIRKRRKIQCHTKTVKPDLLA